MDSPRPEYCEVDKTSFRSNGDTPDKTPVPKGRSRPERPSVFKDYLRVFTYATKIDLALMAVAGFACVGAGVTLPLANVVFSGLVGNLNDYFTPHKTVAKAEFLHSVDRLALLIFIIFLARFVLAYINKFSFRLIGIRISAAIRAHYIRCLFKQTVHVLDSMPSGSAAGTITSTANTLQIGISEKLGVLLEFMTSIITAVIIAFKFSWSLTLVTLSALLFIGLVLTLLLPIILKQQAKQDGAEVQANAAASEAFGSIRMIAAFGAEDRVAQRFRQWVYKARRYGLITSPLYAVQFGLIFFSVTAAFALAFWYGAKSYHEGRMPGVSSVIVVLMNVLILLVSMERISSPLIAIGKAQIAATTFFAIIDAPACQPGLLKEPDVTAKEDIIFQGCTFAYPGRPSVKVLDNLDLTIEAGKVTAIVGPTGCGKSTIVGLLQRWYSLRDQPMIAEAKAKQQASSNEDGQG